MDDEWENYVIITKYITVPQPTWHYVRLYSTLFLAVVTPIDDNVMKKNFLSISNMLEMINSDEIYWGGCVKQI